MGIVVSIHIDEIVHMKKCQRLQMMRRDTVILMHYVRILVKPMYSHLGTLTQYIPILKVFVMKYEQEFNSL